MTFLQKHPENIPPATATGTCSALHALSQAGQIRGYARKELIIREGEPGNALYYLLSGRIRIFTEDIDGQRYVIGNYGGNILFGEGALDGGPRTASIEAVSDCECSIISYELLRRFLIENPELSISLITELIKRSRASTQKMKSLALESVYVRLRSMILNEGREVDGHWTLGPGISQQEIADQLGASRDMITKILRELTKGGYVQTKRGEIVVLKVLPKSW